MSEKTARAQANIPGVLVARMIMEFQREFAAAYGNDTFHSSLCAVGPLQSMIGLSIRNGHLAVGDGEARRPERGTCKRCRFWDNANGAVGYCHRPAPGINHQGNPSWPMTSSYSWCGEFEAPHPMSMKERKNDEIPQEACCD